MAYGQAMVSAPGRYRAILSHLAAAGPAAIFQVAESLGCFDHQISGRFGEMEKAGLIRKTGKRVRKPSTGQWCELYEPDNRQT